jgi:hypothetical protein
MRKTDDDFPQKECPFQESKNPDGFDQENGKDIDWHSGPNLTFGQTRTMFCESSGTQVQRKKHIRIPAFSSLY